MLGWLRLIVAVTVTIAMSLALAPFQILANRTKVFSPSRIPRLWHRIVHRLLGFRLHVTGAPAIGRPLLIVANHVSWTDIVLFSAAADVSFIAKAEMSVWPGFGWLAKMQRSIFVERERKGRSGDQAQEVADRIASGDAMVLFAEGTTSDGNLLLPFKSTLFGAVERLLPAGSDGTVLVQPAAISYERNHGLPMGRADRTRAAWMGDAELVPHIAWLVRRGAIDVEIAFGEPILVRAPARRKPLAAETQDAVRELIRSIRAPRQS